MTKTDAIDQLLQKSENWLNQNRPSKALESLNLVLDQLTVTPDPETLSNVHLEIAIIHRSLGHRKEAFEHYFEALKTSQNHHLKPHEDSAGILFQIATLFDQTLRPKKAIIHYEQAIAELTETLGPNHPNTQMVQDKLDTAKAKI
ncbi:tetratricopeptide repeat protein [bacterium]|nr:tetratricopeptide repeat protein [bacterium]